MFTEKLIRDLRGNKFSFEEFIVQLQEYDKNGFQFFIGTDSQIIKGKIALVTCICLIKEGGGNNKIFYVKEKFAKKDYQGLRSRMLLEAYKSIEAAMEIEKFVKNKLTIHLDVGNDEDNITRSGEIKDNSARYNQELQFLVVSQGYQCDIKPDSWAASSVADRVVKGKTIVGFA